MRLQILHFVSPCWQKQDKAETARRVLKCDCCCPFRTFASIVVNVAVPFGPILAIYFIHSGCGGASFTDDGCGAAIWTAPKADAPPLWLLAPNDTR
jgi:hypothetical protein